jgi:hypothetical protein
MEPKKNVYAQGLYFNPVNPKTPDEVKKWKKGSVSILKDKFIEHLKTLDADDKGYVRFDLTKNVKDNDTFYSFKLNDWKPEPRVDNAVPPDVTPEDIPW